ncbi:TrkH family potassium uptake protein [Aureimonas mangrovi]|uniref:TrkH family potassium uptake protein n=1 Tax=Aureimonas mangrovi TaxID=2758041 RepID=UPI00163D9F25|nr:TrkH family potassium uptake protein [Aureimonas mangrovi]
MAGAMLLPALIDHVDGNDDWVVFVGVSAIVSSICALVAVGTRGGRFSASPRLGFLLVTSVWLTAAFICSLPFHLSEVPISFEKAFYESVSGITTTGGTALVGLDDMPRGLLFWRSLLQWMGGVGLVAMMILILPQLKSGGVFLFKLENSDRSEKLLPRFSQLATALVWVYCGLTFACATAYYMAGMTLFDAVNHAMTTVTTAGFSTHDASLGHYDQPSVLLVALVFMILGALPAVLYIRFFLPRSLQRWRDPQVFAFLATCLVLGLMLSAVRHFIEGVPVPTALLTGFFNLVSLITTTGYSTQDYMLWPTAALGILLPALFIGGCAGSTSGGIKMQRIIVLFTLVRANFRRLLRPHSIQPLKYGPSDISQLAIETLIIFIVLYFALTIAGTILLTLFGIDFISAFSAALSAIGNVGPGFGPLVGPAGNFAALPNGSLWILSFLMLVGRLEIVTVLILLTPGFWRD